eukprot:7380198-Prymnesium_polylepis.1
MSADWQALTRELESHRSHLRHDDDAAVALGRADHRQPDAGVAARRLDYGRARRVNITARLGPLDHRLGDSVFHRAARVLHLELCQHPLCAAVRTRYPIQLHKRRLADGMRHIGAY